MLHMDSLARLSIDSTVDLGHRVNKLRGAVDNERSSGLKTKLLIAGADTSNPGMSISRQIAKRCLAIYGYLTMRWGTRHDLTTALENLKAKEDSRVGRDALVIAGGPSANKLDVEGVKKAQSQGLDVFAINAFLGSRLGRELKPNFYVLADDVWRRNSLYEPATTIWPHLEDDPSITPVVPHTWQRDTYDLSDRTLYFNDCGLHGIGRGTSPLRARRYISLTAYKALAVAIFLGYERVFIIGFDNTMHRHTTVTTDNKIVLKQGSHFHKNPDNLRDVTHFYPQGSADFLFRESLAILDLERYFVHNSIQNLDPNSLLTVFPKVVDSSVPLLRREFRE